MSFNHLKLPSAAALLSLIFLLSPRVASADYQSTVLSMSPAGYWRLNETNAVPQVLATNIGSLGTVGTGTYENDILAGVTGLLPNQGSSNLAVRCEGYLEGNRVRVPYHPVWNTNGNFSVEFWCKPSQTNTLTCPAASVEFADPNTNSAVRRGWLFYQGTPSPDSGNGWLFRMYNPPQANSATPQQVNCAVASPVDTNKWYHIVGTFKSNNPNRGLTLYVNGVSVATANFSGTYENVTTNTIPLTFGARADGDFGFFTYLGSMDEAAFYPFTLSAAQVLQHYQAGTNTAPTTNYQAVVLSHTPSGYWRFNERAGPAAANLGNAGTNGEYLYACTTAVAGPQPPTFNGFAATNRAVTISTNISGAIRTAPLQLNTNTVTLAAWIKPNGPQNPYAGIFTQLANDANFGFTYSGLNIGKDGGFQIGYTWNDDATTYDFPSTVTIPDGQWSFVAVSVEATQAVIYAHDGTTFQTNINAVPHPEQGFNGLSRIGMDYAYSDAIPPTVFNGSIDEVAVFKRTLSIGEVYSLYAAGKGGLPPSIFTDVTAPAGLSAGETLQLSVDAGGTPNLAYQWKKNGTSLGGATNRNYLKANATAADNGDYSVVITNSFGAVTSSVASITVQGQTFPNITQQPASVAVYQNGLIKLSVVADGGGLRYQWRQGLTPLASATNATLNLSPADATNAGSYTVIVSNNVGTVTSSAATVTVTIPAAGSYAAAVVADAPTSWWRLDEPQGSPTFADAMGRNPGVWVNPPTLGANGVSGGNSAAYFPSGGTAYGEVPFSADLNSQPLTVECWVRTTNFTSLQPPVSSWAATPSDRGYMFYLGDSAWRSLIAFNDGLFYVDQGDFKMDRWTHLVLTLSAADGWTTYENGVRVAGPYSASGVLLNTSYPFHIGTDVPGASGWNNYFDGSIDEVAVYSKVLSAQRIFEHYQTALYGSNSLPVFLTQPKSQSVAEGNPVTFTAEVEGSIPLTRQWLKNGVPIPNATNSSLTLAAVGFADSASYRLSATNSVGTSNSQPATLTVVAQPTYANITNALVAHLTFDGNYLDSTGRGNHGYPSNSPAIIAGKIGPGALSYATVQNVDTNSQTTNYLSSFVNLDIRPDLQFGTSTDFSVACWIKFSGLPGDLPFFANSDTALGSSGYTISPGYQTGALGWSLNDYRFEGGPAINDNQWHHIAVSVARLGEAATYVDGVKVDSRFGTSTDLNSPFPTVIGQTGTFAYEEAGSFQMDDLGVWRRALTPIEAYSIYYVGQNYGRSFDRFGPVLVVLRPSGANLELIWQSGTLQHADSVNGPWSAVPGASAPNFVVTPAGAKKFYRVQL